MKIHRTIALACALFAALAPSKAQAQAQESARTVFEQARLLDERNQNLERAVVLYGAAASRAGGERRLAAEAHLRIGFLHERMGKKIEAQRAFRTVVGEFSDQVEVARRAHGMLAAPSEVSGNPEMRTRQIWAGPDVDLSGDPSPDGRYLAYVDWRAANLRLRDLVAGTDQQLTTEGTWSNPPQWPEFAVFSPNGKQIAYAWYNTNSFFDLRVLNLGTSEIRIIYENKDLQYVRPFDWSPDGGKVLALLEEGNGSNRIAEISTSNRSTRVLASTSSYPMAIRYSPDGRYVAYDLAQEANAQERDVQVLSLAGSVDSRLVEHAADDVLIDWSPDGKSIIFSSDRTGTPAVWMIPVNDGRPHGAPALLKADIGRMTRPMSITKDGTYYYGVQIGFSDLFMLDLSPETGQPTGEPVPMRRRFVGSSRQFLFSPDGNFLAYVVSGGQRTGQRSPAKLVIRSLITDEEHEITVDLSSIHRISWSPDGRSFVVGGQKSSTGGIYVVDAADGKIEELRKATADELVGFQNHLSGRNAIAFRHYDLKTKVISFRTLDLDTMDETISLQLERDAMVGLSAVSPSPDGLQMLFVHRVDDGDDPHDALVVLSVADGSYRQIFRIEHGARARLGSATWTPDGKHVLLVIRQPVHVGELWRVNVESGELKNMGVRLEHLRGVAIHPSGRRLALAVGQEKVEVWALEDFLPAGQ